MDARPVLRRWQQEAMTRWEQSGGRGIVAAVTGGGKTLLALHCLDAFRRRTPAATALIVVPTAALLEQWADETLAFFDIPTSHLRILRGQRPVSESRINIGILNTVATLPPAKHPFNTFLIVDECHRAASETFRRVFDHPYARCLGLSATPERQYDQGLEEVLVPHLGQIVYRYTYRDALADKVIVPFELINLVFAFSSEEKEQYDKATRAIRVAAQRYGIESDNTVRLLLRRARLSNMSLTRVRIALSLVAKHRDQKILVFHEDIRACDLICELLQQAGLRAAAYHSQLPVRDRVAALKAYRAGTVTTLVTCRALDEGFNAPETEVGIVAAATATYRQRIQRLGRVLRPATGKSRAIIYSLVASDPEIRRLAEEANDLEGVAEVKWQNA
jgi:superfamily II DNA or RNA helicase